VRSTRRDLCPHKTAEALVVIEKESMAELVNLLNFTKLPLD
jgi:hypothetical protein